MRALQGRALLSAFGVYILNSRMRSAEFVNAVRRARHRAERVPLPISINNLAQHERQEK
jgi:hypothetical protein